MKYLITFCFLSLCVITFCGGAPAESSSAVGEPSDTPANLVPQDRAKKGKNKTRPGAAKGKRTNAKGKKPKGGKPKGGGKKKGGKPKGGKSKGGKPKGGKPKGGEKEGGGKSIGDYVNITPTVTFDPLAAGKTIFGKKEEPEEAEEDETEE